MDIPKSSEHTQIIDSLRTFSDELVTSVMSARNLSKHRASRWLEYLRQLVANGMCTFEDGLAALTHPDGNNLVYIDLNSSSVSRSWHEFVTRSAEIPLNTREVSLRDYEQTGLQNLKGQDQIIVLLKVYFPNLLPFYLKEPKDFYFRHVDVDDERIKEYGDIDANLQNCGIDLDLSTKWHGVWTSQEKVYRGKFEINPQADASYLLIYFDAMWLLDEAKIYDEGALDFTEMVRYDTNLKDLLAAGGVLKVNRLRSFHTEA